jgi:hypothetical protein
MGKKNILIFIHGMVPDDLQHPPQKKYLDFQRLIFNFNPNLEFLLDDIIYVNWGHQPQNASITNTSEDQKLTVAENFIVEKINYKNTKASPSKNNLLTMDFPNILFNSLKEKIIIPGLGDVIYYCSDEGETIIRNSIYTQVLEQLAPYWNDEINIHFIGHSIGAMICHDFLYGIFNNKGTSGFLKNKQVDKKSRILYGKLIKKVKEGSLSLGSFTSCASQIPLLLLRKPALVSHFYQGNKLSATDIGITDVNRDHIKWQLFYDVDDPLGFITRPIYDDENCNIKEIQVNCGGGLSAHVNYWDSKKIARETANLIQNNLD